MHLLCTTLWVGWFPVHLSTLSKQEVCVCVCLSLSPSVSKWHADTDTQLNATRIQCKKALDLNVFSSTANPPFRICFHVTETTFDMLLNTPRELPGRSLRAAIGLWKPSVVLSNWRHGYKICVVGAHNLSTRKNEKNGIIWGFSQHFLRSDYNGAWWESWLMVLSLLGPVGPKIWIYMIPNKYNFLCFQKNYTCEVKTVGLRAI